MCSSDLVEATIRGRLGDAVWGADGETLEDVVCGLLAARGQSLAVLEAGGATGGQVARLLSRATAPAPVVSALVVPQPTAPALARAGFPGVDPLGEGGVAALAAALRARQTVDLALVSAGALPGGRDDGRVECELWVALAGGAGSGDGRALVRRLPIRAARGELQRLATLQALNLLRKELLRMEGERG